MSSNNEERLSKEGIISRLQNLEKMSKENGLVAIWPPDYRSDSKLDRDLLTAAVMIGLQPSEDASTGWDVVLTRRSLNLRHFPGQISLPGGKMDPEDDSPIRTAVRETHEELNIPEEDITPLIMLPPIFVRPHFLTYGVIGLLSPSILPHMDTAGSRSCLAKPRAISMHSGEVDLIFSLPLERFLSPIGFNSYKLNSRVSMLTFYDETPSGETIFTFGFTAIVCVMAAVLVLDRCPDFDTSFLFDDLIQPDNVHKIMYGYNKTILNSERLQAKL